MPTTNAALLIYWNFLIDLKFPNSAIVPHHASIGTATPEKTASKNSSNHKVVKMLYENISDKGAILLDK
jgi:hypothetical protein